MLRAEAAAGLEMMPWRLRQRGGSGCSSPVVSVLEHPGPLQIALWPREIPQGGRKTIAAPAAEQEEPEASPAHLVSDGAGDTAESEFSGAELEALEDAFGLAFADQWQDPDWLKEETL